jgi:hypothetical protein
VADSLEEVIYDYLTADSSFIADYEGVYWIEADGQSYPYIVFWQVDDAGVKTYLNVSDQGEARVQFDLWDDSKARGARLRTALREKLETMNESRGGYTVYVSGMSERTMQRDSAQEPFHFVVDAVLTWRS